MGTQLPPSIYSDCFGRTYAEGVVCYAKTEKCLICEVPGKGRAFIALSMLDPLSEIKKPNAKKRGVLVIKTWLAIQMKWVQDYIELKESIRLLKALDNVVPPA